MKKNGRARRENVGRSNVGTNNVEVVDRVKLSIGLQEVVADVVEDRGHIGVNGRHVVAISTRNEAGEVERFDWPADELTVLVRAIKGIR